MIQIPIEKIVLHAEGTRLEISRKRLEEAVSIDFGLDANGELSWLGKGEYIWSAGALKSVYGALLAAEKAPYNVWVTEEVGEQLRNAISRHLESSLDRGSIDVWAHDSVEEPVRRWRPTLRRPLRVVEETVHKEYDFEFDFEPFDPTRYHSYNPRNEHLRKVS